MVKVGGNEKHIKYVKKHVNLINQGENKFEKVGRKEKFPEIRGKCIETAEIRGNSKLLFNY